MTRHALSAVATLLLTLLLVTACGGTSDAQPVALTGSEFTSPAAVACRAAIAAEVGAPVLDVAVFDVAKSGAGVGVQASVAGAEAPWSCPARF